MSRSDRNEARTSNVRHLIAYYESTPLDTKKAKSDIKRPQSIKKYLGDDCIRRESKTLSDPKELQYESRCEHTHTSTSEAQVSWFNKNLRAKKINLQTGDAATSCQSEPDNTHSCTTQSTEDKNCIFSENEEGSADGNIIKNRKSSFDKSESTKYVYETSRKPRKVSRSKVIKRGTKTKWRNRTTIQKGKVNRLDNNSCARNCLQQRGAGTSTEKQNGESDRGDGSLTEEIVQKNRIIFEAEEDSSDGHDNFIGFSNSDRMHESKTPSRLREILLSIKTRYRDENTTRIQEEKFGEKLKKKKKRRHLRKRDVATQTEDDKCFCKNNDIQLSTVLPKHHVATTEKQKIESDNVQSCTSTNLGEQAEEENDMILKIEENLSDMNEQKHIRDIFSLNKFDKNEDNVEAYENDSNPVITTLQVRRESKINYILQELIETEEQYVDGLKLIVHDYILYLIRNNPQVLSKKIAYVFGHIEHIYRNAEAFLKCVKKSTKSPDCIAEIFINKASDFELYSFYAKYTPVIDLHLKKFDELVQQRQEELKDQLGLATRLLSPIDRLGKYGLLLKEIQKEESKTGKSSHILTEASDMIRKIMKNGNDSIATDSIKNSPLNLTQQGSLMKRSLFQILGPKRFTSMVFLFSNAVVFTEKVGKTPEKFQYVDSILMSDLKLDQTFFKNKPKIFHLIPDAKYKKYGSDATYVLEAESPQMKEEWTRAISKKLWRQFEEAKKEQENICKYTYPQSPTAQEPNWCRGSSSLVEEHC